MNWEELLARLIQADKRVVFSEKHTARQKEFADGLERLGNNCSAARALLDQFEKIKAIQVERRNAILRELENFRGGRAVDHSSRSDE
jgi:hypothetical protein